MKPSFMIALVLSITSLSSAAMLFLDSPRTTSLKRFTPQFPIEIKWGEGSEAGVPEPASRVVAGLSNDEPTYVFAGKCPSQEPYRLVSYQKNVTGGTLSFYDYEGPNGKGTVQSETSPKVMAARVCRKMAEIINANYWE